MEEHRTELSLEEDGAHIVALLAATQVPEDAIQKPAAEELSKAEKFGGYCAILASILLASDVELDVELEGGLKVEPMVIRRIAAVILEDVVRRRFRLADGPSVGEREFVREELVRACLTESLPKSVRGSSARACARGARLEPVDEREGVFLWLVGRGMEAGGLLGLELLREVLSEASSIKVPPGPEQGCAIGRRVLEGLEGEEVYGGEELVLEVFVRSCELIGGLEGGWVGVEGGLRRVWDCCGSILGGEEVVVAADYGEEEHMWVLRLALRGLAAVGKCGVGAVEEGKYLALRCCGLEEAWEVLKRFLGDADVCGAAVEVCGPGEGEVKSFEEDPETYAVLWENEGKLRQCVSLIWLGMVEEEAGLSVAVDALNRAFATPDNPRTLCGALFLSAVSSFTVSEHLDIAHIFHHIILPSLEAVHTNPNDQWTCLVAIRSLYWTRCSCADLAQLPDARETLWSILPNILRLRHGLAVAGADAVRDLVEDMALDAERELRSEVVDGLCGGLLDGAAGVDEESGRSRILGALETLLGRCPESALATVGDTVLEAAPELWKAAESAGPDEGAVFRAHALALLGAVCRSAPMEAVTDIAIEASEAIASAVDANEPAVGAQWPYALALWRVALERGGERVIDVLEHGALENLPHLCRSDPDAIPDACTVARLHIVRAPQRLPRAVVELVEVVAGECASLSSSRAAAKLCDAVVAVSPLVELSASCWENILSSAAPSMTSKATQASIERLWLHIPARILALLFLNSDFSSTTHFEALLQETVSASTTLPADVPVMHTLVQWFTAAAEYPTSQCLWALAILAASTTGNIDPPSLANGLRIASDPQDQDAQLISPEPPSARELATIRAAGITLRPDSQATSSSNHSISPLVIAETEFAQLSLPTQHIHFPDLAQLALNTYADATSPHDAQHALELAGPIARSKLGLE